jgi:hypothetical protein
MIDWRKSSYSCPVVRVTRSGSLLKNQLKVSLNSSLHLDNPLSLINFPAGLRPPTGKDSQEIFQNDRAPNSASG